MGILDKFTIHHGERSFSEIVEDEKARPVLAEKTLEWLKQERPQLFSPESGYTYEVAGGSIVESFKGTKGPAQTPEDFIDSIIKPKDANDDDERRTLAEEAKRWIVEQVQAALSAE